jgi:hypothetical protein
MSRIKYILYGLILIGMAGCSTASKQSEETQPAAQEPATQAEQQQATTAQETPAQAEQQQPVKPAPAPVAARTPSRSAPAAPAPSATTRQSQVVQETQTSASKSYEAAPNTPIRQASQELATPQVQEPKYATIPSGTGIQVRLQDPLDSSINRTGDTFRAILDKDIEVNGNVVAPRGSAVEGKLTKVVQSGRVEGRAAMSLQLVDLRVDQQSYPLQTNVLSFEAESSKKSDATKVGIGAGLGAVIGAIAGGGKGAAIGAAVGGGAGGATVLATRGKEVKFDSEQKFSFTLNNDVSARLK